MRHMRSTGENEVFLVEASITIPGYHKWPKAPYRRRYLQHVHRHLFVIKALVEVSDSGRAVEFHDLQDALLAETPVALRTRDGVDSSCEMLAQGYAEALSALGYTVVQVSVSEDGENTGYWRAD
jgi:hypothetical protein